MVLTNGLKATDGQAYGPDTLYAASRRRRRDCSTFTDATQKQVCQLTKAHLGIAQAVTGTSPATVILSWSFSTQSVDDVLDVIVADSHAAADADRADRRSRRKA